MDYVLFSPNVTPLLRGIKPYLPENGKKLINGTLSIIDMLTSSYGQNAVKNLTDLFLSAGPKTDRDRQDQSLDPSLTTGLGIAFALFLVLILLILCCVFLFGGPLMSPPC